MWCLLAWFPAWLSLVTGAVAVDPALIQQLRQRTGPPATVEAALPAAALAAAQPAGLPPILIEQLKRGTVLIRTRQGEGSGFFIGDELVLTNGHVLAGLVVGSTVQIVLDSGTRTDTHVQGTVGLISSDPDLGLVVVPGVQGRALELLDGLDGVFETTPVVAVGFPLGSVRTLGDASADPPVSLRPGAITALHTDARGELSFIEHNANMQQGSSGGPLVDGRGRVIGINVAMLSADQTTKFAIPSPLAARWLTAQAGTALVRAAPASPLPALPVPGAPALPLPATPALPLPATPASPLPATPASPLPATPASPLPARPAPVSPLPARPAPVSPLPAPVTPAPALPARPAPVTPALPARPAQSTPAQTENPVLATEIARPFAQGLVREIGVGSGGGAYVLLAGGEILLLEEERRWVDIRSGRNNGDIAVDDRTGALYAVESDTGRVVRHEGGADGESRWSVQMEIPTARAAASGGRLWALTMGGSVWRTDSAGRWADLHISGAEQIWACNGIGLFQRGGEVWAHDGQRLLNQGQPFLSRVASVACYRDSLYVLRDDGSIEDITGSRVIDAGTGTSGPDANTAIFPIPAGLLALTRGGRLWFYDAEEQAWYELVP